MYTADVNHFETGILQPVVLIGRLQAHLRYCG